MNKMLTKESTVLNILNSSELFNLNKTALIYENSLISFEQLGIRSNQLANYIKQRGIFFDIPLCFCLNQSIEKVIVMLAIWKAGGAYVSLDPYYPKNRLQHVLEDTDSPILITTTEFADKFSFYKGEIILIDEIKHEIEKMPENTPDNDDENGLAYLAYTSGSTGIPKAVMAEHKGLKNFVKYFGEFLQANPNDTALNISSSNFDGIVLDLWVPLSLGMTVHLYPDNRIVGKPLLDYIVKNEITVLPYLPVSILATLPTDKSIGKLRKICTGGEAPSATVINPWKKKVELINIYGPTETTVVVSGFKFDDDHPLSTIGKPLPNVEFYVLNEKMNPVRANEIGELYIGGIQVTRGYYNQPELTDEKFVMYKNRKGVVTRLYKTGDLMQCLEDGTVAFAGRADQQVKIRGFRVEPSEIEETVRKSGLAENCCVIVKGELSERELICFYKNNKNQITYPENLREYLFERLPNYMIPAKFLDIEDFPLTDNGKINRHALKNFNIHEEKRKSFIPAENPLQIQLATAWNSVLNIRNIGIRDNFFQFGGNSILAYKLVSTLRQKHNISLQASDLFLYPTIQELENYLTGKEYKQDEKLTNQTDLQILSSQQQSLYFIDKLYGSTAYNVGAIYHIDEHISLEKLQKTFHLLLKKHCILRSIIEEKDGLGIQSYITSDNWMLEKLYNQESINELIKIPFDLQRDYMLRAYIIYEAEKPVSLFLIIHHMVTDGWAMPLIIEEINNLYQQVDESKPSPIFKNIVEYKEYTSWQLQQNIENGITFWKEYLDEVPVLHIAHDSKKQQYSDSGKQYQFEIDEDLIINLKKISEANSTTLYTTLLSAFGLLMQYYSGQNDICIGSPSANRPHYFDKAIGYFANMLPIRMKINGNPLFTDFLKQNRDMLPKVFQHQEVPLETIISNVIKDRFAGQNPLFQNIFVLQNPVEEIQDAFPIISNQAEYIFNNKVKFDLQFEAILIDRKLKINIDYSDVLFKDQTISEMAKAFRFILESIVINPNKKVGDIDIFSVFEKEQVSTETFKTPKTFIEIFEKQVKKTPENIALFISGMNISYQELDFKSSNVAQQLIDSGLKTGDFIACFQEQSIERIITLIGILKSGAAYVPLDVDYPSERIKTILHDTQPRFFITNSKFKHIQNEIEESVLYIEDLLNQNSENIRSSYSNTYLPNDLAYIIHTSGTTGTPKGVMIEHQSLGNFISEYGKLLELNPDDKTLQFSPYNFDGSVIDLWIPLANGTTVYLYPNNKLLGNHLSEFIVLHQITKIPFISPSVLSTIPENREFPNLKVIGTGAESCPLQVSQHWKNRVKLFNMYGPTEATVAINQFQFDHIHKENTIGKSIENTKLYVLDQYHRQVPNNVIGELYISGIQLSKGYLNQLELTAEKFINNPFEKEQNSIYSRMYKTGDQVKTLSDGLLEYIGRADHQVKIRGYRIELLEIENTLHQLKGIKKAAVTVHKNTETLQSLKAFVVADCDISDIKTELSKKLPAYMIPNEIFILKEFPVKSNGKIDWETLNKTTEITSIKTQELDEKLLTRYEKILKNIWKEVLQCKITSLEDDFFHLGGHSLLLTKLYNKIYNEFPNTITLSELYTNSTIKKLALLIEERELNPHIQNYGLGEDPLSNEIRKDSTIAADFFKFTISEKGNFENPKATLLTGVTGFVGINILVELLKTSSADIYLLIRAEDESHAKKRLFETMENQLISTGIFDEKRIKLLSGDLAKPFFGLSVEKYNELTQIIDVVHHAGSAVNFIQPYSYMKAANVDALYALIKFVTTYKVKQLSLLSTVGAFSWEHHFTKPSLLMEDSDTKTAFKYLSRDMGYIQSKWVMEQVAQEAINQGVPIIIFRLGYVFCHSMTGATAKYQWWGALIRTCVQLKSYPILINQKEELVMVDFVSQAIANISRNPDSIGKVFHLSPEPKDNMTVTEFFEMLRDKLHFDLKPIPYQDWMTLWENDENSPLYPLLNLFKFKAYDNKSLIEIHQNTPNFDISNTKKFLQNSKIENTKVNPENVEAFCKYLGIL